MTASPESPGTRREGSHCGFGFQFSALALAIFFVTSVLSTLAAPSWIALPVWASEFPVAGDSEDKPLEMRLQLQFTFDNPTRLEGFVGLERGSFSFIENLSFEPNTTGAFWTSGPGSQLRIQPRGHVKQLGLAVDIRATRNETITFELTASRANQTHLPRGTSDQEIRVTIPLQDLINGVFDQQIAGGVQLRVSRVGGDALRIHVGDQRQMIFSTGEVLLWNIETTAAPHFGKRPLALYLELRREDDRSIIWQQTRNISPEITAQIASGQRVEISEGQWTLPQMEGVYSFTARLGPSTAFRLVPTLPRSQFFGILGDPPVTLERRCQFVVLGPFPDEVDPTPFAEIARWRPENRGILTLGMSVATSGQTIAQTQYAGVSVSSVAPGDQVLQTLPTLARNKPHVLVVRYARSEQVSFTLSVRDAGGAASQRRWRNEIASSPDRSA